jgi:hypothetical protein
MAADHERAIVSQASAWMLTPLPATCFISMIVTAQDLPEREHSTIRANTAN